MEFEKISQKISLESLRLEKRTIFAGAILSIVFFIMSFESFHTYQSDILILVNVKSPIAIKQQEQIFNNILQFPTTLSFYDTMLFQNPDVRDVALGLNDDQRKEKWNEMISVSRVDDQASVFKLSVTSKLANDSNQLASKSARTLFDTVAFYYDVKKDFDLRIIEGPIAISKTSNWFGLFLMSLIGGFGIAIMISPAFSAKKDESKKDDGENLAKNLIFDFGKKTKKSMGQGIEALRRLYQSDAPFVFEEKKTTKDEIVQVQPEIDPRIEEMKKLTKQMEPGKYPNFPEMPARNASQSVAGGPLPPIAQASAPSNLPVAEDDFMNQYQEPIQTDEIITQKPLPVVEKKPEIDTKKEPTPEELKKRLNQLLRGEF